MKRTLCALCALVLAVGLCACGNKGEPNDIDKRLQEIAVKQIEIANDYLEDRITLIELNEKSMEILKDCVEVEKKTDEKNLNRYSDLSEAILSCNSAILQIYSNLSINDGKVLSETEFNQKLIENEKFVMEMVKKAINPLEDELSKK